MNILVCLKQILDPDIPARDFKIDPVQREALRGTGDLVIDIFCENAVETALKLRDRNGGNITVMAYGNEETEDALRKAIAMKVDQAALILKDGCPNPDPLSVAQVLAGAAKKIGGFDLIMVGRESGDWGVGQTGGLLAEALGVPFIGLVDRIETCDFDGSPGLRVRRQTDSGYDIIETSCPLVVSVSNCKENLPRIPKTRDVMQAYRKPILTVSLADLDVQTDTVRSGNAYYEVVEISIPTKEIECEFVQGDSLDEKVDAFSLRVSEVMSAVN